MWDDDRMLERTDGRLVTSAWDDRATLSSLLADAGLAPDDLARLPAPEIFERLSAAGIDPADLTDAQLAGLLDGLAGGGLGTLIDVQEG
jgi:hypothetical protein